MPTLSSLQPAEGVGRANPGWTCSARMQPMIGEIGKRLSRARGTVVVVSNPVDVLTQRMTEVSGLAGRAGHRDRARCSTRPD